VDRFGAQRMTIVGLVGIACGASVLSILPARFAVVGYLAPIVVMTASYALFQAANNLLNVTSWPS
jgi:amino acid permease